jgi:hypothetical protein
MIATTMISVRDSFFAVALLSEGVMMYRIVES